MSLKRSPGSVDHHVGSRVKLRRRLIGMSQERLADQIGVAFQQVQKYEKGTNRIGASRLMKIAEVLGVTPGYFFEQDGDSLGEGVSNPTMLDGARTLQDFVSTKEGLTLNRAFSKITDPIQFTYGAQDAGAKIGDWIIESNDGQAAEIVRFVNGSVQSIHSNP